MAETSNSTPAPRANPVETINNNATTIQSLARRSIYLVTAIGDAVDDACGDPDDRDLTALDRICVFAELIGEAADKARDLGEEIEKLSFMKREDVQVMDDSANALEPLAAFINWRRAMALYLDAETAAESYQKNVWDPADAALAADKIPFPQGVEAEYERLAEIADEAKWALMATPAPDGAAVSWKLDYLIGAHGGDYVPSWNRDLLEQTIADYHRLLADA